MSWTMRMNEELRNKLRKIKGHYLLAGMDITYTNILIGLCDLELKRLEVAQGDIPDKRNQK